MQITYFIMTLFLLSYSGTLQCLRVKIFAIRLILILQNFYFTKGSPLHGKRLILDEIAKFNHTISHSEQDCKIFFCEIFLLYAVCRTTVAVAAAAIAIALACCHHHGHHNRRILKLLQDMPLDSAS